MASAPLPLSPLVDPRIGQALIEAASTDQFAGTLLGAARRFDAIDEVFAYQVDAVGGVRILLATGDRRGLDARTDAYAQRFHVQDPLLQQRHMAARPGGFTRRVRASDLPDGDYRALCFDEPGFVDKLSFGWRGTDSVLVLSFYRGLNAHGRGNEELAALGQLAMSTLGVHAGAELAQAAGTSVEKGGEKGKAAGILEGAASAQSVAVQSNAVAANAQQVLLQRLARSYPQLTERERQIVALTLLGDSSAEIGQALSIKPATVLTYRQRAYERYRFGSASDFLAGLLH